MTTLTKAQKRAVEFDDADLCVVAGAGTGKTHVLTERVVRLVRGDFELRRLLAITFTEKAAAQMKSRLAAALREAGHADAWAQVERAAISTVHAFCARVLREHAVEAGLAPGFAVMDEVESERTLREALDVLVHDLVRTRSPDLAILADLPGAAPDETLLAIYRAARESTHDLAGFVRLPGVPAEEGDPLAPLFVALDALRGVRDAGTAASKIKIDAVLTASAGPVATEDEGFTTAVAVLAATNMQLPKAVKPAMGEVRSAAQHAVALFAEGLLGPARDCLARTLVRLDALYDTAKGSGERLDFADLERRAVALLRDREAVREAFRGRWAQVLVDEFQDTNPVQSALVELIRPTGALFVVGDPKQAIYGFRGSDVSVFLATLERVRREDERGEVHLAHSFRARPELLGVVNRLFHDGFTAGPGEVVPYRPLAAGKRFATKAEPCVETLALAADDLRGGRLREAAWIADRVLSMVEGSETEPPLAVAAPTDEEPLRTRAATYGDVAILLRATTNVKMIERALTGRGIPYLVVKGRGFHAAREVIDLANLLSAVDQPRDDLLFAAVLRSPACGVTDDGLFALCAAKRRAVRETEDDAFALVDVLLAWRDGTRVPDLDPADERALRGFAAVFSDLRAARAVEPLTVLVERALAATGLELLALGRPGGRQRAANLRKVVGLARERDFGGNGDLTAFIADMRELRAREVRETEAPVAAAATGAVSILTVHASKGLEFPIVFVPDLARGEMGARGSALVHHTDGLGLALPPSARGRTEVKPWSYTWIKDRNQQRSAAEGDRLLYVAVTRAEEHLCLTTAYNPQRSTGPWWTRIADALGLEGREGVQDVGPGADEGGTTRALVRVHAQPAEQGAATATAKTLIFRVANDLRGGRVPELGGPEEAQADTDRLLVEASRKVPDPVGTLYATTVSALVTFARSPEEFHRRHVLGLPETLSLLPTSGGFEEEPDFGPLERAGDDDEPALAGATVEARAAGRAVHLALERLVPEFAADVEETVRQALALETAGAPVDPAQVRRLVRWVEGFRDSELGREACGVERALLRREQAFLFTSGRTVVRGQLDLVFRSADGWVVVDYKAGRFDEPDDAHLLQMRLYALGMQAVTGEAPARLVLFSLPGARAVEVPCPEKDLAELRGELLEDFGRRTAVGDFSPRP